MRSLSGAIGMRTRVLWLGFFTLAAGCGERALAAQAGERFSSTRDYQSMLEELRHDPVRPSRMSAGTLLGKTQIPVRVEAQDTAAALTLETEAWRLRITKKLWSAELQNKRTKIEWTLGTPGSDAGVSWTKGPEAAALSALANVQGVKHNGNSWQMQVATTNSSPVNIEISVLSPTIVCISLRAASSGDKARHLNLPFNGTGPFFGLGERFDQVKLDGLRTTLVPEDLLGQPGHNWTYIPVPFLFTPRGLGVYLDSAVESAFDLSQATQQKFSAELEEPSTDAYLFVGEPKQILADYTSLTGRSPVAPPWAFGVWICSYQSPQRVLEDARRLKAERIPASAIWTFDVMGKADIMGWPLWWTGYYPHPNKFTQELHQMGLKVLTYVHPYLRSVLDPYNLPNPNYDEGARRGLFVLDAQGQPTGPGFEPYRDGNIDFTSAANVDWWEKKIRSILLNDGFDGWMEDFGEWVKERDRFAAGVTGRLMANLNPLFYHKITYEISHRAKPDAVEFVRSGYAGSQGFTQVVWGGDQFPTWARDYGLPSVVNAGISAGLSGFSTWTPDIAENGKSQELWTRWVEFGALTATMRDHRWDKPEGAINLWSNAQTIDLFRRYANLHISLFPYLYAYARQAAETGLPIMRHPLLEFPNDPKAYESSGEYLLGEKILVAPVLEQGASSRSLYVPQGSWTNYWTGQVVAGGRNVTVEAPLEQIPLFVRAGSVIPFNEPVSERLAWRVFPTTIPSRDTFTLFDGTVAKATQADLHWDVSVAQAPAKKSLAVVIPAARRPREIKLNGERLTELPESKEGQNRPGWKMDEKSQTVRVEFEARDFDLNVYQ